MSDQPDSKMRSGVTIEPVDGDTANDGSLFAGDQLRFITHCTPVYIAHIANPDRNADPTSKTHWYFVN